MIYKMKKGLLHMLSSQINDQPYFFILYFQRKKRPPNWIENLLSIAIQNKKYLLVFHKHEQKQRTKGVLRKSCSENMQQIYRRTPMPKCDFNKVWNQLRHRWSPINLLHILRTPLNGCFCTKLTACMSPTWSVVLYLVCYFFKLSLGKIVYFGTLVSICFNMFWNILSIIWDF